MNSGGLITKCVVPSRQGALSLSATCPAALSCTRSSDSAGRVMQRHNCSSRLRSCASTRTAACSGRSVRAPRRRHPARPARPGPYPRPARRGAGAGSRGPGCRIRGRFRTRLAGRAGPAARLLARHKQSPGLFVSGLSFDEPGQLGPGAGLGMGDETGRMLLHQAVQRGLLGAVALVAEPVGLGGPHRARSRARRLPAGDRHGGGAAQSGAAQRRSDRRACPPPCGSPRWGMPIEGPPNPRMGAFVQRL